MKKLKNRMKSVAVLLLFLFSVNSLVSQTWTTLLSGRIRATAESNGYIYAYEETTTPTPQIVIHKLDTATWTDMRIDSIASFFMPSNINRRIQFIGNSGWYIFQSNQPNYDFKIRHTIDGGQTWSTLPAPIGGYVSDFQFTDQNNGYEWAYDGISAYHLYHTSDGGQNWAILGSTPPNNLSRLFVVDSLHIVDFSGNWHNSMSFSDDKAQTWTLSDSLPANYYQLDWYLPNYYDLYFTSIDTGYISLYNDVYYTTNRGQTFTPINAYAPVYSCEDTSFTMTHLGGDTLIVMGPDNKIHTRASGNWHMTNMPNFPSHQVSSLSIPKHLLAVDRTHLLMSTKLGLYLLKGIYSNNCAPGITLGNTFNCLTNISGTGNTYVDSYDYVSQNNGTQNPNYTYAWTYSGASNINLTTQSDSTSHYNPVSNGTYTVSVIATNPGCPTLYDTNVVTINQTYIPHTPYLQNNGVICKYTNTNLNMGPGASAYAWFDNNIQNISTSQTLSTQITTNTTFYSNAYLNGCINGNKWVYNAIDSIRASITYNPACVKLGTDSVYAIANTQYGNGPYTYTWGPGPLGTFTTSSVHFRVEDLVMGTYTLTVTDANGCAASSSTMNQPITFCDSIWPGDADNDLYATNYDVLDLGMHYGATGLTRPGATSNWAPQLGPTFYAPFKPNGFNIKHDDCNGDGVIDANDTLAIVQNYGYWHNPYKLKNQNVLSGPPLNVQFVADSTTNSTVVTVKIMLGSSSNPANNVYGLAFSLSLDTSLVKSGVGSYNCNNSWLSPGSPSLLSIKKELYNQQRIDMAVCRTNQTNISGYGEVAEVEMIMRDDISGKVMFDYIKTLQMSIFNAKVISANGDTIEVNPGSDSLVVTQTTGISENAIMNHISWYPNPVKNELTVKTSDLFHTCSIIAANGSIIYNERQQENTGRKLDVSELAPGVYMLKLTGDRKTGIIKFVKYE